MVSGIIIETSFLMFIPLVLFFDYLYFAGLRAWLEGLSKGARLAVLSGVALFWIAFVPGPLTFVGAFVVSMALGVLAFFQNVKEGIKTLLVVLSPTKARALLVEGCGSERGCFVRYLFAWPALAALAATAEALMGPLTMYIIGLMTKPPSLKGKLAVLNKLISIVIIIVAWAFAFINILKNLILPHWLLLQEYAVSGEVSKLPLTARLLAKVLGKEAAYVYVTMLVILAAYTAIRVHTALDPRRRREIMAAISPFVAYAVSMNKLGEPLTSVAYAAGVTSAYFMRSRNIDVPATLVDKVMAAFAKLGRAILEYSAPLGPLRRLLA
ncbi:hypothetical protein [Ignicoccus hospitalis]|uniref:hypothetical protein n=1 Tax=Ignicoccus hospitalis TaxID=160233 RepID=UPI0011D11259|nr:hypothetical protein [Ignicoccus hospitalis]